jgi:hypothetical protein
VPPLLPATEPLLLEVFFFPVGEDSGDSGVEGPLKEANLPLITKDGGGKGSRGSTHASILRKKSGELHNSTVVRYSCSMQ